MKSKNGKKASGKTAPWLKTLAIILTLFSAVPQAQAVVAVQQNSAKLLTAETTKNFGKSPKEIAKLDFETLTNVPEKSDISQSTNAKQQKEGGNSFEQKQNSDEKMSQQDRKMEPIGGSTKSIGSNDAETLLGLSDLLESSVEDSVEEKNRREFNERHFYETSGLFSKRSKKVSSRKRSDLNDEKKAFALSFAFVIIMWIAVFFFNAQG